MTRIHVIVLYVIIFTVYAALHIATRVTFKNNSKVHSVKKNHIWDITKQEYDEFNIEGKEEDVSYMAHETDKKKIEELQKTWHHENIITENALQVLHGINKAFNHGSINTEWTVTNVCIN